MNAPLRREGVDCAINHDGEGSQARGNGFPGQWLTFPKHYLDGHIDLMACSWNGRRIDGVVSPFCNSVIFRKVGEGRHLNDEISRRTRVHIADLETIKSDQRPHGQYELVLVGDIQLMESVNQVIPARVRLQFAEPLSSLFSGECYLTMGESRLKTFRFPAERKLDVIRSLGSKRTDDVPSHMVQRRPQVMHGVPDNERKFLGNGFVYINAQGALSGLGVVLDVEFGVRDAIEFFGLGDKVFDVMLGPL